MAFHEVVADDEAVRFAGYAEELLALQRTRNARSGRNERALHAKQHIGAVGEFVVTAATGVGAGVFANAGTRYPVYARFSNASSARQNDRLPDARGFAIKLVGVPGKKLIPGLEDEETQDFLFVSDEAIAFRDPVEFMTFVRSAKDGPLPLLPRLFSGFGFRRGLSIIGALARAKMVRSFATADFHTVAPIAFGATAAKLGLFPTASESGSASGEGGLRADLLERLEQSSLTWTLRARLFVDDASTPVEDTSVVWASPWLDLGQLTLARRDPGEGAQIDEVVEHLSFDPWHAIEAHRPLGAIMRARRVAYGASVKERKASPEPSSVPELAVHAAE
jgi:hypothetical protein